MSMDLMLKPTCGGCGTTSDLYGSNCKHLTLCSNCGKTMAENRAKCYECGTTLTRLIREYNVRASSSSDKNYFIGRFATGLPNFSKKKSAENKWTLQKEGLHGRQVTDALRREEAREGLGEDGLVAILGAMRESREWGWGFGFYHFTCEKRGGLVCKEKYKNKPWLLEDETGQSQYQGHLEGAQSATYYLLMMQGKEYNFNKVAQYKQLTLEEAEEKMKNRRKTADGYQRWMMKAANNGSAVFPEIEKHLGKEPEPGGGGGVRGRKKSTDEDEGHVSDKGEEDEEEAAARKARLGLNKRGGDDEDDEAPRGGDFDDDDDNIEKGELFILTFAVGCHLGDDWEHEEIFTDDDEAVAVDPEEREDLLAPELPAPPEIKQDDDDEEEADEEEGGLSKSGRELKKLLGRANGLNDSDGGDEEADNSAKKKKDEEEDDDDMDEEDRPSLVLAPKKEPKEEPSDNSPAKSVSGVASRGTPASKFTKGKRKSVDETKPSSSAPPKKVKTENEVKSTAKEDASKTSVPAKSTSAAFVKAESSSSAASGPVSEEEIRAVLLQKSPMTTSALVSIFKARLKSPEIPCHSAAVAQVQLVFCIGVPVVLRRVWQVKVPN
ncbi:hypothetical protein Cgig2_005319 [Carnegiea gigantea]|uniref:Transcription initiation factor IIF subunit alpha n=1 Tax=Carnegiea gigantea TaxID=171969 RepID=A0A9Q1GNW8_9CARY|nr:hypothetical protein Cgig2_005319 [Carnegiea gigantea]